MNEYKKDLKILILEQTLRVREIQRILEEEKVVLDFLAEKLMRGGVKHDL